MSVRQKVFRAEVRAVNEDAHTVEAVVSSETQDRDGDIIRVSGWNLKAFRKHPVLLANHNYYDLRAQIGEWKSMRVDRTTKELIGTAEYYVGKGNEQADWAFELAKMGKAAFSVGFIPDMEKAEKLDDTFFSFEFKGQELLEVSAVTVPSNPDGLQRAKAMRDAGGAAAVLAEIADELEAEGKLPDADDDDIGEFDYTDHADTDPADDLSDDAAERLVAFDLMAERIADQAAHLIEQRIAPLLITEAPDKPATPPTDAEPVAVPDLKAAALRGIAEATSDDD